MKSSNVSTIKHQGLSLTSLALTSIVKHQNIELPAVPESPEVPEEHQLTEKVFARIIINLLSELNNTKDQLRSALKEVEKLREKNLTVDSS